MKSFSSSKLNPGIVRQLEEKGILVPTEIQEKSIAVLLDHKGDFVARSATGTGKTFAFGAPLLSRIMPAIGRLQAVVLVPTRELCEQVGKELEYLAEGVSGVKVESIYGGVSLKDQIHELSNGVQVVVATPGRMMDLVGRGVVDLSVLKFVVFDEADEMLLKGFRTDIDKILESSSRTYSTWLFSATMPDEINGIIKKYLNKELIKVAVGKKQRTNLDIDHQAIEVIAEEKQNVLLHFLARHSGQKGIIFCRTKSGAQKLYKQLSANKFSSGAIHGDLPQGLRNKVMDQFREGSISLLIATDVASRGVDVEDVDFVIQYHVADTADAYTHRSGRTSRAGKKGFCLTFVFEEELEGLNEIEQELDLRLTYLPLPSAKDQLVNKAILWAQKIAKEKPVGDNLDEVSKQQFKSSLEHLSKDELFEKLLASYLRDNQG